MRGSNKLRALLALVGSALLFALAGSSPSGAAPDGPNAKVDVVWIYRDISPKGERDTRGETERLFAPYGFMPGERARQTSVNASLPIDPKDRSKGTAIEYAFEFKGPDDWMGAYSLLDGGTAWGTKAGINVQELLGVGPDAKLALRFQAKGEGAVTFKIGGVSDGPFRSSLRFPLQVGQSPTRLSKEFREYTIGPIAARDLVNLIDPFCVVTSAHDNRGVRSVRVIVDDIRLESFDKPRKVEGALSPDWRERLTNTLFIAYTPTGFDPTTNPITKPTAAEIRADLAAIRSLADKAGIKGERAGIITYGCRDGLEDIAPLAKEARLSVILGVYSPRDEVEVANAHELLKRNDLQRTIVACCVGNEALTFRRATLAEINQVTGRLGQARRVPMTTTEIIQAYGDKELFKFDFTFANAHAIFADVHDPERGAKWAVARLNDLIDTAPKGHLILAKELGWPGGPGAAFDAKQQSVYWRTVLSDPVAGRVNVCIFDGLNNVPWKNEMVATPDGEKVNVGPHWPVLFDADRKPKVFAEELLTLWKKSWQLTPPLQALPRPGKHRAWAR